MHDCTLREIAGMPVITFQEDTASALPGPAFHWKPGLDPAPLPMAPMGAIYPFKMRVGSVGVTTSLKDRIDATESTLSRKARKADTKS